MAKIYYADDEKEIRDIVSTFLVNEGYAVHAFETETCCWKSLRVSL